MVFSKFFKTDEQKRLIFALLYDLKNVFTRSSILGECEVTVSLTSYGGRIRQAHRAIESIGMGKVKPKRIILWLSFEDYKKGIPKTLKRLISRGLEVLPCEDYKSFKKFYPYVCTQKISFPLVTADDDVAYPRWWLQFLVEAHKKDPDHIHAHRCRIVLLETDFFAPYKTWPFASRANYFSRKVFPTGVGGVIYPVTFQLFLKKVGDCFLTLCPRADDVWIHLNIVRSGILASQIRDHHLEPLQMPWTLNSALCINNVDLGGNDQQINNTYEKEDIVSIYKDAI